MNYTNNEVVQKHPIQEIPNKEFDLLVFIGRFQPFHNEHKRIINIALQKSKNVLVLVGSSGKSRTIRNPFTFEERFSFIRTAFPNEWTQDRISVEPIYDKTYNDVAWIKQIQNTVVKEAMEIANPDGSFPLNGHADLKIGLIGASKDHTSYYLKMFPQWESVNVSIENEIHATAIREMYLEGIIQKHEVQEVLLPKNVCTFLFEGDKAFNTTDEYKQLQNELRHVKDYKKQWEAAPYPVKHVTIDCVVEQSGHILLIRRKAEPGKGLWALPGGHLEEYEKIEDGAIRELKEETKIKVPESVLRGSIVNSRPFDDPHRSTLGRVITYAYHIKLKDDVTLPKIKGSDDADKAKWVPISELREDILFDDHYAIISWFLGV